MVTKISSRTIAVCACTKHSHSSRTMLCTINGLCIKSLVVICSRSKLCWKFSCTTIRIFAFLRTSPPSWRTAVLKKPPCKWPDVTLSGKTPSEHSREPVTLDNDLTCEPDVDTISLIRSPCFDFDTKSELDSSRTHADTVIWSVAQYRVSKHQFKRNLNYRRFYQSLCSKTVRIGMQYFNNNLECSFVSVLSISYTRNTE